MNYFYMSPELLLTGAHSVLLYNVYDCLLHIIYRSEGFLASQMLTKIGNDRFGILERHVVASLNWTKTHILCTR